MPSVVSIVKLGGYPDFSPLFASLGYEHEILSSGRKAIAYLKKNPPQWVIAEFYVQSDFRDRTGNLESVMALLQGMHDTRVLVLYESQDRDKLELLHQRFPIFESLPLPVNEERMREYLLEARS